MKTASNWFVAITGGVVVMLGGLSWDAVIHSREHEHVAHESLVDLSNPGHLVFAAGLVLTAVLTLAGLTLSRLHEGPRNRRWQATSLPASLWVVVGLAGAATLMALKSTG